MDHNGEPSAPDTILRGMMNGGAVRVVATIASAAAREAAGRHGATGGAAVALGRAAASGLLLATLTKAHERVTMQILGDGPLGGLTVDANSAGNVRVFVKHPRLRLPATRPRARLAEGVGKGLLNVVRDLGLRDNFSGQTELVSGEIDEDVEHHLVASEQIDSVLVCETVLGDDEQITFCGGVLLQALPNSESTAFLEFVRTRVREGALAEALATAGCPTNAEDLVDLLLGPDGEDLQTLDVRPVKFACPCSVERASSSLSLLDDSDLEALVSEGSANITCEFCRAVYTVGRDEIEAIRTAKRKRAADAS